MFETKVIKKTINPEWNELFVFSLKGVTMEPAQEDVARCVCMYVCMYVGRYDFDF
jgi:hypothetical protein